MFQKVSKGSKTLVKLSDFAFSFTSLPPKNIADNTALNELYTREAKSKDYSNSTFYFELFTMEWVSIFLFSLKTKKYNLMLCHPTLCVLL